MDRTKYLDEVFGCSQWKDIKNILLNEAKHIKTKDDIMQFASKYVLFMSFDSSIHTIKNRSLEIRNLLVENNLEELTTLFKIDGAIYGSIKKDYKEKIKKENEVSKDNFNHLEFTEKTIKQLTNNIENNIVLSKSNMSKLEDEIFYQKLFVLALATGRRQIELLKTLSMKKKKDLAIYEGLSKKRNDDVNYCEAPILIDIKIAKKYLNDIHSYLEKYNIKNLSANEINSKLNGRIGNAIKRYIGDYTFHFFRSCYAHTCYIKNNIETDQVLYFQTILGHQENILPAHAYTSK